jgi:hypothetical protein
MRANQAGRWAVLAVMAAVLASTPLAAQMKPTAPGTAGDPAWQGIVKLTDGRTFVTDGGIALDAALAKPAALPERVLPPASAKTIERYLAAALKDECASADLKPNPNGRTYIAPSGLALSTTYVNFLRRVLPARTLRFRMGTELEPMVIVSDGKAVGVLMGVKR